MSNIKLILFGILIGIGKILPGVSGSIIAIMLGVYEIALNCLNNPLKRDNILYLGMLSIGFISSILIFSNIISYLLSKYYNAIMLLFIAILIATTKTIKKSDNNCQISFVSFLIILIIFTCLDFLNIEITINPVTIIILGILEGISMIVPGISGTAILISLNSYDKVITAFATIDISFLIYYFIGVFISFICTSKIIINLLKSKTSSTNSAIYGIVVSTIIIMIINVIDGLKPLEMVIFCLILTITSYLLKKAINLLSIDRH